MTVSLGGVALDDSLVLVGFKNRPPVAVAVGRTILGRPVVQTSPVSGGALVLEARLDGDRIYGRYTGSQIDQIRTLWAAAAAVTMVHHLGTWQVIIQAVDVQDVQDYADPGATDLYTGTITMIEV